MTDQPSVTTLDLFREYFGHLRSQPCWETETEFSLWLSLRFGRPELRVMWEANPSAASLRKRKRFVRLMSEFQLFFEFGRWIYWQDGEHLLDSDQPLSSFHELSWRLHSQCLSRVEYLGHPAEMAFHFDCGGRLHVQPSPDAAPDQQVWIMYTHDRFLRLRADGTLEHGLLKKGAEGSVMAEPAVFDV